MQMGTRGNVECTIVGTPLFPMIFMYSDVKSHTSLISIRYYINELVSASISSDTA